MYLPNACSSVYPRTPGAVGRRSICPRRPVLWGFGTTDGRWKQWGADHGRGVAKDTLALYYYQGQNSSSLKLLFYIPGVGVGAV